MAIYFDEEIEQFRKRWEGKEELINEIFQILKIDNPSLFEEFRVNSLVRISQALRSKKVEKHPKLLFDRIMKADKLLTEYGFPSRINIEFDVTTLPSIDLRGITFKGDASQCFLYRAQLEGSMFGHTNFQEAFMEKCNLEKSYIEFSSFLKANLFNAHLESAIVRGSYFKCANLRGANLIETTIIECDFKDADLEFADLTGTNPINSCFVGTNLSNTKITGRFHDPIFIPRWRDHFKGGIHWKNLKNHILHRWFYTNFAGVRIDDADTVMAPDLYRYVKDQQYLYRFKQTHPWIYKIWKVFSDCGGKLSVVAFWAMFFVILFSWFYPATNSIDADSLSNLTRDLPAFWKWLFVSFDIFSNLGIRNTHPQHAFGVVLMITESVLGLMMLGMLLSVLQNRFARRS